MLSPNRESKICHPILDQTSMETVSQEELNYRWCIRDCVITNFEPSRGWTQIARSFLRAASYSQQIFCTNHFRIILGLINRWRPNGMKNYVSISTWLEENGGERVQIWTNSENPQDKKRNFCSIQCVDRGFYLYGLIGIEDQLIGE